MFLRPGLNPQVTESDVQNHLHRQLGLDTTVEAVDTKYNTYASFHITCTYFTYKGHINDRTCTFRVWTGMPAIFINMDERVDMYASLVLVLIIC